MVRRADLADFDVAALLQLHDDYLVGLLVAVEPNGSVPEYVYSVSIGYLPAAFIRAAASEGLNF